MRRNNIGAALRRNLLPNPGQLSHGLYNAPPPRAVWKQRDHAQRAYYNGALTTIIGINSLDENGPTDFTKLDNDRRADSYEWIPPFRRSRRS